MENGRRQFAPYEIKRIDLSTTNYQAAGVGGCALQEHKTTLTVWLENLEATNPTSFHSVQLLHSAQYLHSLPILHPKPMGRFLPSYDI